MNWKNLKWKDKAELALVYMFFYVPPVAFYLGLTLYFSPMLDFAGWPKWSVIAWVPGWFVTFLAWQYFVAWVIDR